MIYLREQLIGRWYRHDVDEHGSQTIEYADILADGSFEFTFVTTPTTQGSKASVCLKNPLEEGDQQQIIELGDWGLVGDIHFTLTKNELVDGKIYAADLNNADNYHAYRVLQLTHQIFEYQHIVTNEVFIMRRVIDNIGHC